MNITSFYTLLLNDAWTIYMTFSGILISIRTLLYSVILGKRSELELYAKLQKEDEPFIEEETAYRSRGCEKAYTNKHLGFCNFMYLAL